MERRQSARVALDIPVSVIAFGHRHDGRAVDLSASGMVFHRPRGAALPAFKEPAPFDLHLGGGRRVIAYGRTVWLRNRHQGVRFEAITDEGRAALADVVGAATAKPLGAIDASEPTDQPAASLDE